METAREGRTLGLEITALPRVIMGCEGAGGAATGEGGADEGGGKAAGKGGAGDEEE